MILENAWELSQLISEPAP
ncbi:unnamed protein product [Linum tenue]|uniref:Uncharacterized protein n=1 Tax=Linum tenue TaxID=586396 RepID=A0AAV0RA52_9ROSI|nr:unnamed protein product [Linum tenue]CAI0553427.1 unnamed protein product [Linum tenue]